MKLSNFIIGLGSVLGLAIVSTYSQAEPDVLTRPAIVTAKAMNSVMLAVTRAGHRLIAVGERGFVILSDDDGQHWRQATTPVSVSLTNVQFPTEKSGWAVGHGGIVLRSANGGESWTKQLDGKQAAQIVLDSAKEANATAQQLAEAERLVADGADKPFLDVHFTDESNGMIVGAYGLILRTRDGGATWHSLMDRLANPKGKHLYQLNEKNGEILLAGEQGALFVSGDGANSFREINTPYKGTYFGVISSGPGRWLAYGLRGNAYCTSDSGRSWQKVDTGAPVTVTAGMHLSDNSIVLADESGRLLQGHDCSTAFHTLPVPNPSPITALAEASDGAIVLTGTRGISRYGIKPKSEPR